MGNGRAVDLSEFDEEGHDTVDSIEFDEDTKLFFNDDVVKMASSLPSVERG